MSSHSPTKILLRKVVLRNFTHEKKNLQIEFLTYKFIVENG